MTDSPLRSGADAGSALGLWDLQKDAAAHPEKLKKNQAKKKAKQTWIIGTSSLICDILNMRITRNKLLGH